MGIDEFRCNECERDFSSQEALDQHNKDKHGTISMQPKHELKQIKKHEREKQEELYRKNTARSKLIKKSAYAAIPVIIVAALSVFILSQPQTTGNAVGNSAANIPKAPIHWHPKLEVIIKGKEYPVPINLGASGAAHFPVHTHTESDGTLHYEVNSPTFENMRLGYFFERVWRKQFNSTCIIDYCNGDSGNVRMYINGKENFEFENYIPIDMDEIKIEFN